MELVGYEDVEARSHEVLTSLVVHRKWDEETGEILETTREYYDRGGRFVNIPDKFPCVIYFGVVDFEATMPNIEKLDWIYIGDKTYE